LRRTGTPTPPEAATITATGGPKRWVAAVNRAAALAGLRPGMALAHALAMAPQAVVHPHDSDGDRMVLTQLAERARLFTPWAAVDEAGSGLWLDIGGCAHLFGGEAALLDRLGRWLGRAGFSARVALAATPGAAWAWARFGKGDDPILADMGRLAPLSLAALRLGTNRVDELSALGLRRIGEVLDIPRAQLTSRFGPDLVWRLDQLLGDEPEAISPRAPPVEWRVHTAFAEPISRPEDMARTLRHLLDSLCARLEAAGLGARRLDFTLFRVDGSHCRLELGTGAPSHDAAHLARLFRDRLAEIRPDFGIEAACLDAPLVQLQPATQTDLGGAPAAARLDHLLDSLTNRLGGGRVMRLVPRPSHVPERCVQSRPAAQAPKAGEGDWPQGRYPIRLLEHPQPIEAMAPIPDAPPLRFRWQGALHQVVRADGPERIAPEWWHEEADERDYYRVEDSGGLRFWLFRKGHYGAAEPPRWYLHGVFP
jgi:protein ImuB